MIFVIASREIKSLLLSPLGWSVLAVVEFIMAYLFLGQLDLFLQLQPQISALQSAPGVTELVVTASFGNASIILLLVIPLLTMRLISEERRGQTLALLFSAPISMTEIVLGKFLGVMTFLGIMLVLIALMPLSLLMGGTLDFGMLFSGLLGLFLLLGSFTAAGLFISTLTNHPPVAAVSTFGLLLLLWILDWAGKMNEGASVVSYISILRHYEPLLNGVFKSSDIIYYLLFMLTFLVLSVRRLDSDRLQH